MLTSVVETDNQATGAGTVTKIVVVELPAATSVATGAAGGKVIVITTAGSAAAAELGAAGAAAAGGGAAASGAAGVKAASSRGIWATVPPTTLVPSPLLPEAAESLA